MNLPLDNQPEEDDFSDLVADVFELPREEPAAGTEQNGGAGDNGAAPNEPSVGTEGEEASGASADGASSTPPADGGTGSAAGVPEADGAKASPTTQPPQTPPAQTPTSDPQALELASLRAQLQAATAAIEELKKPAQQPGQPAPAAGQQDQAPRPKVEPINVQLPNELVQGIFSDEPQQAHQALNVLVSTLATGLTTRFEARLQQAISSIEEKLKKTETAASESTAEEEAKKNRDAYFQAFPHHNKPVLIPILAQEAQQLAAQYPGAPWDDNFRNALGARVDEALKAAGLSTGPGGSPTPTAPTQPAKPASMMPTGTRPTPEEDDNIIADTFSF